MHLGRGAEDLAARPADVDAGPDGPGRREAAVSSQHRVFLFAITLSALPSSYFDLSVFWAGDS